MKELCWFTGATGTAFMVQAFWRASTDEDSGLSSTQINSALPSSYTVWRQTLEGKPRTIPEAAGSTRDGGSMILQHHKVCPVQFAPSTSSATGRGPIGYCETRLKNITLGEGTELWVTTGLVFVDNTGSDTRFVSMRYGTAEYQRRPRHRR